ncbi:MAG: thioredoxin family protein [Candidatus Heimdallarchaeota archaeon]|nr:thioredoxin family protein [Candidatus Heimdallarchaeota archaeon]
MTKIEIIIGSGSDSWCSNCKKTDVNIQKVLKENFPELEATVDHINVTKPENIKKYGSLMVPALIINDIVVHEGSIPPVGIIKRAITQILEQ